MSLDAHSRVQYFVAEATALGARMRQGAFYLLRKAKQQQMPFLCKWKTANERKEDGP
ncbi:MAG: hypothetical protein LIO76_10860 [Clostridiales bacterium]|nr:hypothetical protein [Clostridiales bacterium]